MTRADYEDLLHSTLGRAILETLMWEVTQLKSNISNAAEKGISEANREAFNQQVAVMHALRRFHDRVVDGELANLQISDDVLGGRL